MSNLGISVSSGDAKKVIDKLKDISKGNEEVKYCNTSNNNNNKIKPTSLIREVKKSAPLVKEEQKEDLKKNLEEKKTECEICFEYVNINDTLLLNKCKHLYHSQCLLQHFTNMIEERKLPLICPSCRMEVTIDDLRKLLPPELISKWENYTFKHMIESNPKDYSYCPTPDCPYIFIWEEGKDTNLFTCPQCKNSYCLNCKCKYHKEQTCMQYRQSKEFVILLNIQLGRR